MNLLERQVSARLKGKTVWITGGKRVGQAVAKAFAEQGSNLIVSYLNSKPEADVTVAAAQKMGVKAIAVQMDVSARESVFNAVRETAKAFPKVNVLVNLASVFSPVKMEHVSQRDWDVNVQAHVLGTFWPIQALAPRMPRGSHIINIADRTSLGKSYKNYIPYIVTKAGVQSLTKAAAKELADKGIFVNAIAPGPILKPPFTPQKEWDQLRKNSPIQYPVNDREAVEQFALLSLYLASVTMTSGCTYALDQGQNL